MIVEITLVSALHCKYILESGSQSVKRQKSNANKNKNKKQAVKRVLMVNML